MALVDKSQPIAIVGIGCVYPGAGDAKTFYENVSQNKTQLTPLSNNGQYNWERYFSEDRNASNGIYPCLGGVIGPYDFPIEKFEASKGLFDGLDDCHLAALDTTRMALDDLEIPLTEREKRRTCVIMGNSGVYRAQLAASFFRRHEYWRNMQEMLRKQGFSHDECEALAHSFESYFFKHPALPSADKMTFRSLSRSSIATTISRAFRFSGGALVVDVLCASSLCAMEVGVHSLWAEDTDVAIVGGTDFNLSPSIFIGFCRLGALAGNTCLPFDASSQGLALSQGAGTLVLKRLSTARASGDRIYGVISGIGSSSDGSRRAIYTPSDKGQALAMSRALRQARWDASTVQYVEAHATGTIVGDATELRAIESVYGGPSRHDDPVKITSTKGLIGHPRAAAGVAGVIKTLCAMRAERYPPHAGFKAYSPLITDPVIGATIPTKSEAWTPHPQHGNRRSGVSASGFGGVNYHVLLEYGHQEEVSSAEYHKKFHQIAVTDHASLYPGGHGVDGLIEREQEPSHFKVWSPSVSDDFFPMPLPLKKEKYSFGTPPSTSIDPLKFRIPPRVSSAMDFIQVLTLDLVGRLKGIADGRRDEEFTKTTACIIGTMIQDGAFYASEQVNFIEYMEAIETSPLSLKLDKNQWDVNNKNIRKRMLPGEREIDEEYLPGWLHSIVSGRVSKAYNIQGVNMNVDAGEASSAAAYLIAGYQLRFCEVDRVIAGGLNTSVHPGIVLPLSAEKRLSQHDTPAPFQDTSDGMVLGTGGSLCLFRRKADAEKHHEPIHLLIDGISFATESGLNGEGYDTTPRVGCLAQALMNACAVSSEQSRLIDCVDVMGYGVPAADEAELEAIGRVCLSHMDNPIMLSSAASHVGSLMGGSTAMQLLSMVSTFRTQQAPGIGGLLKDLKKKRHPQLILLSPLSAYKDIPMKRGAILSWSWDGAAFGIIVSRHG